METLLVLEVEAAAVSLKLVTLALVVGVVLMEPLVNAANQLLKYFPLAPLED